MNEPKIVNKSKIYENKDCLTSKSLRMKKFNAFFQDEAVKDSVLVALILAAIAAVSLFLI